MDAVSIDVRSATADRWDDVATLFGRSGSCWCQVFVQSRSVQARSAKPDADDGPPSKRAALHDEITAAVGWTRVGPRSTLPGVLGNRALAKVLTDDGGVWWVACFKVDSRRRRAGFTEVARTYPTRPVMRLEF